MNRVIATALLLMNLCSCSYFRARHSENVVAELGTVTGTVTDGAPLLDKPIIIGVALETGERTFQVVNFTVAYHASSYSLAVAPGSYYLFAFVDTNANGEWDPEERAGVYGGERAVQVIVDVGHTVKNLDIALGSPRLAEVRRQVKIKLPSEATEDQTAAKMHPGEMATLKDERFSREAASYGFWQPVEFLEKYGAGVFMLEPYDPKRIPVVFTHGINGTPLDFEKVLASVDRKRFQVWVVDYPSGLRLHLLGRGLANMLDRMQQKLGFQTLFMVAHSMGGLVTLDAIANLAARPGPQYVKLLVTFSTPWNGHDGAGMGVRTSPIVVPSWLDMAPGSPFLKELQAFKPPADLPHYLLFGYVGGNGSDGTVSLASMLTQSIQDRALEVHGYPENHDTILSDAAPIERFNRILAANDKSPGR